MERRKLSQLMFELLHNMGKPRGEYSNVVIVPPHSLFISRLEKFEIPRAVFLVSAVWTPESGLLTAAMKLKRKALETAFSAEIVGMYSGLENNNNNSEAKNLNLPMTNSNNVTNV